MFLLIVSLQTFFTDWMWFLQKFQTKGYDFLLQLFSKEIFRFNAKNDLFSPILQKRKCINNDKVNFFSPLSNVLDHDCVCKFYDCYYYQRERLSRCSRFRGRFFSFCVREQCNTCNNKLLFLPSLSQSCWFYFQT